MLEAGHTLAGFQHEVCSLSEVVGAGGRWQAIRILHGKAACECVCVHIFKVPGVGWGLGLGGSVT